MLTVSYYENIEIHLYSLACPVAILLYAAGRFESRRRMLCRLCKSVYRYRFYREYISRCTGSLRHGATQSRQRASRLGPHFGIFYPDSTIAGFSHTHLSGTGAGDLYDISFMPVTLPYKEAEEPLGIHSRFSHADESASAGYYRVLLKDYDINVELTATERCGIQRYTFPQADAAVILNLRKAMNWDFTKDSYVEKVDSVTIQGYRFLTDGRAVSASFPYTLSRPFETMRLDSAAVLKDGKESGLRSWHVLTLRQQRENSSL